MHSFLVEALQLLVTFLADEDPTLISNVQAALRHLLNTKPGQLALADLGALQKAEAAVFTPLHPLASPAPATGCALTPPLCNTGTSKPITPLMHAYPWFAADERAQGSHNEFLQEGC